MGDYARTDKLEMSFKRLFDGTVAGFGLVVLAPVMLGVAVAVAIGLGRPILFRQLRTGKGGRPFWIYKFRTMLELTGADGAERPDAERITRLGAFLRRTSLDELPQLINVLKGDMSLVGPRPLLPEYLPLYTPEQARRHEVPPGLTGWAQVNGRNRIDWEERLRLDVWYVDNHSFVLDLKIIALTLWKIFASEEISQKGHVTMERFRGTG